VGFHAVRRTLSPTGVAVLAPENLGRANVEPGRKPAMAGRRADPCACAATAAGKSHKSYDRTKV
jgi:hypothetical protein